MQRGQTSSASTGTTRPESVAVTAVEGQTLIDARSAVFDGQHGSSVRSNLGSARLPPEYRAPSPWSGRAALAIVMLGIFLAVKALFRLPNSDPFLFAYGICVTLTVFVQVFVSTVLYRDPALSVEDRLTGTPLTGPRVSCLVAVHNELEVVEACLASMTGQTYVNKEVIVIDDASTDGTGDLLEDLALRYDFQVIRLRKNVGKKRALGAGMLEATGEIYAFTDSDSTWAPDAIEKVVTVLEGDPRVGAVSGHCRAMNSERNFLTRMQDSWYEGQFSVRKAFESYFGAVTCVSGPLAVFRKEAVYNFIPTWEGDRFLGDEFRFATDRTMTGFVLMDAKSARRLRAKATDSPFAHPEFPIRKWRVVYCKSARSMTVVPDSLRSVFKQQARWKKSFIRNIFFTGRFYWRRNCLPSLVYYLHILFVLAGPFVAFRHLVYLPMRGNYMSMVLYICGIVFIGSMFGLLYSREDRERPHRWVYRPLMSLFSTLALSWLVLYSACTIKKMNWARG